MAVEQLGIKAGSKGCKELLIIDSFVATQVTKRSRNTTLSWIDYRKTFDSVPHDWLLKGLKIYKVNQAIIDLLERLMKIWRVSISTPTSNGMSANEYISIKRGIFQGDSLSPQWFCLVLNPLS